MTQKSKNVVAATAAVVFVLLLGGVSLTLFPAQAPAKAPATILNAFVPTSTVPQSPPQWYVVNSTSSSAFSYSNADYWSAPGIIGITSPTLTKVSIEKDGSINSTSAPIQRNGNIYKLTGDITNETITVQRSNIILDGNGYKLEGYGINGIAYAYEGVDLEGVTNVTVENFRVDSFWQPILVDDSSRVQIEANNITNCPFCAVEIDESNYTVVENNFSEGTIAVSWASIHDSVVNNTLVDAEDGIQVYQGSYNTVIANNFRNVSEGIGVSGNSNVISNNVIVNGSVGIEIYEGSDNLIAGNTLADVYVNIGLDGSPGVISNVISNNTLVNGVEGIEIYQGTYSYGSAYTGTIEGIYTAENSTILGNAIDNMTDVALSYSGQNGTIYQNTFESSKCGVWLEPGNVSEGTVFYRNNFIDNTQDVKFNSTTAPVQWDNDGEGNYWSNYNGTDHNGGGVGDTPYDLGGNNTDYYPLMQPTTAKAAAVNSSMGQLFFTLAIAAGAVGLTVSICFYVKSLKPTKKEADDTVGKR